MSLPLLWTGLPQAQTLKLAGMVTTDPFALITPSRNRSSVLLQIVTNVSLNLNLVDYNLIFNC